MYTHTYTYSDNNTTGGFKDLCRVSAETQAGSRFTRGGLKRNRFSSTTSKGRLALQAEGRSPNFFARDSWSAGASP